MRDLPDMYVAMPKAQGIRAFISGKSQMHMLQVLCNTFIAIVTTPEGLMSQVIVILVCGVINTNIIANALYSRN